MGFITIYRLAEQAISLIEGGNRGLASSVTFNEVKIACGQVINKMLKIEYLSINGKMGEIIPNGSALGLYEDIAVTSWNGKSKAVLPIKPIKLPRNMGVWAIYPKCNTTENYDLDKEFIPLQMGQGGLLKSQLQINDLLGQVGYETFGDSVIFTKDIKSIWPNVVVAMRLVILDALEYDDYSPLPLPPEFEWDVIKEVYAMYSSQPIPDKVVDSTAKENKNIPLIQQKQSS